MIYDAIIVGHGLAGSVLSHSFLERQLKVFVIDKPSPQSSSSVAAGLFNPITGRRVVKSWLAEELLPFANKFYQNAENSFGAKFLNTMDVLEFIYTVKDENEWMHRMHSENMKSFLSEFPETELYRNKIRDYRKIFRINSSGWLNIPHFISLCRNALLANSCLDEAIFNPDSFKPGPLVNYNGIQARRIVFCEGIRCLNNPLWSYLPMVPAKGEILKIRCQDLPEKYILLSGLFLIPLNENHFRIGATFEWNYENENPTEGGKKKLVEKLDSILKVPYEVIAHSAGIRPTVKDRRPLVGRHPDFENVFIFNGLGTKGVQLSPYFANQLINFMLGNGKIHPEADVNRFKK